MMSPYLIPAVVKLETEEEPELVEETEPETAEPDQAGLVAERKQAEPRYCPSMKSAVLSKIKQDERDLKEAEPKQVEPCNYPSNKSVDVLSKIKKDERGLKEAEPHNHPSNTSGLYEINTSERDLKQAELKQAEPRNYPSKNKSVDDLSKIKTDDRDLKQAEPKQAEARNYYHYSSNNKSVLYKIKKERGMKRRSQRIQDIRSGKIDLAEEFSSLSLR